MNFVRRHFSGNKLVRSKLTFSCIQKCSVSSFVENSENLKSSYDVVIIGGGMHLHTYVENWFQKGTKIYKYMKYCRTQWINKCCLFTKIWSECLRFREKECGRYVYMGTKFDNLWIIYQSPILKKYLWTFLNVWFTEQEEQLWQRK